MSTPFLADLFSNISWSEVGAVGVVAVVLVWMFLDFIRKSKSDDAQQKSIESVNAKVDILATRMDTLVELQEKENGYRRETMLVIKKDLEDLNRHILTGNGKPSLLTRVSVLEIATRELAQEVKESRSKAS